jgi:Leucine-rich repeat (LRR) protein
MMNDFHPDQSVSEKSQQRDQILNSNQRKRIRFLKIVIICACLSIITLIGLAYITVQRDRIKADAIQSLREKGVTFAFESTLTSIIFGQSQSASLRAVYADRSTISDSDLESLKHFPLLESLHLPELGITDKGLEHVSKLTSLKVLSLSGKDVTDKGLKFLATLQNLDQISLSNTPISDEGLQFISSLPQLKSLFLDGTNVTDNGLKYLAKMPALKNVTLDCKGVTDEGVKKFRPLCPHFIAIHR